MPIGPPSEGGSGVLALPLPPEYQPSDQPSRGGRQQQPLPSQPPTDPGAAPSATYNHSSSNTSTGYSNTTSGSGDDTTTTTPPSFDPAGGLAQAVALPRCVHGRTLTALGPPDRAVVSERRPLLQSITRKYVLLCGTCGLCSLVLGALYLLIYGLLRSYTSSLHYFETMPTYVPASVQMVTGALVCCFVRRQLRVPLLVKLCGCLCLVCAVLCVVVTVTTTVLHMNRLQTLHECEYLPDAASCTCTPYAGIYGPGHENERYVFSHVSSCVVIHGPLYACLRAMFGLSVIGILVSIFSCMLVYQLLSHEKKKMYWEQLESRRRQLYRRPHALASPSSGGDLGRDAEALSAVTASSRVGHECGCCTDDYGFPTSVTQEALYPYALWDTLDERCWSSGLMSPGGDADGGNGARSLLLHLHHPSYARGGCVEEGARQHPHHSGVILRPFMPRGLEGRMGFRRSHPHGSRPLSDPGVALHLPPYPPPSFPEAFMPMGYPDAFPGYLWGPPPPYSQPTSTENIPNVAGMPGESTSPSRGGPATSPSGIRHDSSSVLISPGRRPPTLADLMRGTSSPPGRGMAGESHDTSPTTHQLSRPPRARHKRRGDNIIPTTGGDGSESSIHGTNSLPHRHRAKKLTLGHVKSLGDVTENKHDESLEVLFCDGKEINSINKIQRDIILGKPGTKHLKSISDPKSVYSVGKVEPESEIYFADVSSCVSVRPDSEEVMYYSDPTSSGSHQYSLQQQLYIDSSQGYPHNLTSSIGSSHMYEQVREENDNEDAGSHHTSDDTMIVHTSSSDPSFAGDTETAETENMYSVISPTPQPSSCASPVITDTDGGYSCYSPPTPAKNEGSHVSPNKTVPSLSTPGFSEVETVASCNEDTKNANILELTNTNPTAQDITPTTNNLNLHHPLHPVHQPHHQAFHHHLTHHHSPVGTPSNSNGGRKKREKRLEKRNEKKSSKNSCKLVKNANEPSYDTVHETVSTDQPSRPTDRSIARTIKLSPAKHKHDANLPGKSSCAGQSPLKHKSQHRHRKYHTHHHHHHSNVPVQSSSSSSSLSSPRLPSTHHLPEPLVDPNGNVSRTAATNSFSGLPDQTKGSEATRSSSKKPSDEKRRSPAKLPVAVSKKTVPEEDRVSSPVKKHRANLSLPLRKLTGSSNVLQESNKSKSVISPVSEKKSNSSPTKDRESVHKKRSGDKAKAVPKTSLPSENTRKVAAKDLSVIQDSKSELQQPSVECEIEPRVPKTTRRSKVESDKIGVTQDTKSTAITKPITSGDASVREDTGTATETRTDAVQRSAHPNLQIKTSEQPDTAKRTTNVQHLLQNLKSVNV